VKVLGASILFILCLPLLAVLAAGALVTLAIFIFMGAVGALFDL
jgi:hypothetical protein